MPVVNIKAGIPVDKKCKTVPDVSLGKSSCDKGCHRYKENDISPRKMNALLNLIFISLHSMHIEKKKGISDNPHSRAPWPVRNFVIY